MVFSFRRVEIIISVEIIQAGLPVLFIGGKLWIDRYEFKFFVETRFETQTLYERNRKVFYLMHVLGGQLPWYLLKWN